MDSGRRLEHKKRMLPKKLSGQKSGRLEKNEKPFDSSYRELEIGVNCRGTHKYLFEWPISIFIRNPYLQGNLIGSSYYAR